MKKKVKMLKDAHGCEDGFTMRLYKGGEVYELPDHLAQNFVVAEFAIHHDQKMKPEHENKALDSHSYDNKSIKPSKNKGDK